MMHTLLYNEMNQAVPGVSLSPGHESGYGECQVPSPSQWSDPCYSPPSFHSPQHLPGELEKVKEEPFSPPPQTSYLSFPPSPPTSLMSLSPQQVAMSPPSHLAPSPPRSHHASPGPIHVNLGQQGHHASPYARPLVSPKKEGFEASLNIADLLAENQSLSSAVPQVPSYPPSSSPSYLGFSPPSSPPLYNSPSPYPDHPLLRTRLEDAPKKAPPLTSSTYSITQDLGFLDSLVDVKKEVLDVEEALPGSSCGSPAAPSPGGCSPTQCQRDILETVEKLALEHARRDVLMVSESLNIPCDPAHWSVEDVKKWLKLQAAQLSLPPPMLDFWNLAGPALLKLTEAQFRHLAPVGGELLYAQLEIWREALRSSPKLHVHHHYYWQLHEQMLPLQQQQQQQQQPQQQQPSPQPQQYQPQAPSPRSIGLPQVPTPVAQVNQQQAQQQGQGQGQQQQQQQQQQGQGQQQGTVVYLDDPCVELTSLLRQSSPPEVPSTTTPTTTPTTTTTTLPAHSPHDDPYDSDDAEEEECVSPGSGRGATHIHLWQFLKELLQQPQLYGSCIRWLDRQKGVFKIEDSVRVARLWGKRKNRPAMNYDKLSRSIRQYYKKGIMKKTERSQRLVYQFCHPYCL